MICQSGSACARRFHGLLQQGEVPLGVDHHALGLGPHRGGQEHVGVGVGLGVGEDVLGDDELGGLQARDDGLAVGDAWRPGWCR